MEKTCTDCSCTPCMCNVLTVCGGGLLQGSVGTFRLHSTGTTAAPQLAQGWECPRCRAINAPYASQCTCVPGATFAPPYVPYPVAPPPYHAPPVWEGVQYITSCALNGPGADSQ